MINMSKKLNSINGEKYNYKKQEFNVKVFSFSNKKLDTISPKLALRTLKSQLFIIQDVNINEDLYYISDLDLISNNTYRYIIGDGNQEGEDELSSTVVRCIQRNKKSCFILLSANQDRVDNFEKTLKQIEPNISGCPRRLFALMKGRFNQISMIIEEYKRFTEINNKLFSLTSEFSDVRLNTPLIPVHTKRVQFNFYLPYSRCTMVSTFSTQYNIRNHDRLMVFFI